MYPMLIASRAVKPSDSALGRVPAVLEDQSRGPLGVIRTLSRTVAPPAGRRALILMYHRVAEPPMDPWYLSVSPRHFAEQLDVLRQHARLLRVDQLSRALRDGDVPDRSVVVTFDDGYADNLRTAKSLLELYNVPATVFLTTGYIGQDREFWWDEL